MSSRLTPPPCAYRKGSEHPSARGSFSSIHRGSLVNDGCSALVGSKDFIARAKWFRKAFGGGVRQSGSMAAAADYAITNHFPRLAPTHALAKRLAEGLEGLGCNIIAKADTSMVRPPLRSITAFPNRYAIGLLRPDSDWTNPRLGDGTPQIPSSANQPDARTMCHPPPD